MLLEVQSAKFCFDTSQVDCCCAVLYGILQVSEEAPAKGQVKVFARWLKKLKPLFLKFHCSAAEKEVNIQYLRFFLCFLGHRPTTPSLTHRHQQMLHVVVEYAKTSPAMFRCLNSFLHYLYDHDLMSEEVLLTWESDHVRQRATGSLSAADAKALAVCSELLQMLKESSEESESD